MRTPELAAVLFGDREELRNLWDPQEHSDSRARIDILLGQVGVDSASQPRARVLVQAVVFSDLLLVPEATIYAAYLAEKSPAVTRRELKDKLSGLQVGSPLGLSRWVNEIAGAHGRDEESVIEDLFRVATDYRQALLGYAADCRSDAELEGFVQQAADLRGLLEALAFDVEGFVGDAPVLGPADFGYLLRKIEEFSHFRNCPAYCKERDAEQGLAEAICLRSSLPIPELMAELRVWDTPLGVNSNEVGAFRAGLLRVLRERLRDYLIEGLSVPGRIRSVLASAPASRAARSVLLSADGLLSEREFREDLRIGLQPIITDEAVYENAWEFMDLLRAENRSPTTIGTVRSPWFAEVASVLLEAVRKRPVQPRMVGALRNLEHALGLEPAAEAAPD